MAKRYLLKKKSLKIKTWIYVVARFVSCTENHDGAPVEKLCWSCLSRTLNLFHPPCPLRLKLPGSSMALLLGKCWCCLSPVDAEPVSSVFSGLFFFFFLSFFVSSKPVTFLFLRFLPIFSLLCTTWNFANHTFFSVFLSPHSDCPLIRCDEALWRNVIFSRKKILENQRLGNSAFRRFSKRSQHLEQTKNCHNLFCGRMWRSRVANEPVHDKKGVQTTFFFFQLLLNRQQRFNPETRAFLRLMLTKLRVSYPF